MSSVPIIGRGCPSVQWFTRVLARSLGLPELHQDSGETEQQFLLRRLDQIKWCNRHWALAHLERLTPELLELAAMQICDAAANYCQDKGVERDQQRKMMEARR
jgi:hypothetical protein